MEGDIALIAEAARKASRFLLRDYYELERLQNSNNSNTIANFSNKSVHKAVITLTRHLEKYFKYVIFEEKDIKQIEPDKKAVLVEPLDGFVNFSRSTALFGIMITVVKKKENQICAEKSLINFPVLGELIRAEKNCGVFLERYSSNIAGAFKLKTSSTKDIKEAVIALDNNFLSLTKQFSRFRFYGSSTYSLFQLISGKIDAIFIRNRAMIEDGIKLFIEEAGGKVLAKPGGINASNLPLFEKIKDIS
ncbi:MAG TPA: inositol monophosphatase family protein [Candidatus Megaira endosymbiont of Nemacystus decipiens]|nr:inositol monophosphatase family protein [Candidatus Megaera endosymbiont of Nemacystus decipiens]